MSRPRYATVCGVTACLALTAGALLVGATCWLRRPPTVAPDGPADEDSAEREAADYLALLGELGEVERRQIARYRILRARRSPRRPPDELG